MLLKNGKTLCIRKTEKQDAQELLDYLKIIGGESDYLTIGPEGVPFTLEQEEQFIETMNSSPTSLSLVGLIDDKIVSVGGLSASSNERISHQCTLGITVLKDFWSLGIGTCMMHEMIQFAKASGKLEVIHLGVHAENTRAIDLYKGLGFEEIGRYPKFFKINSAYFDEVLMNLYL